MLTRMKSLFKAAVPIWALTASDAITLAAMPAASRAAARRASGVEGVFSVFSIPSYQRRDEKCDN
jgi:hypothetical protein